MTSYAQGRMKTESPHKGKRGRKPSGRETHPVNFRMERTIRDRLVAASKQSRKPQIAYVEEGLEKVLPKNA